uniref:Uncharacterized protein n=1 Tax=Anguilla anguilla TaxID=7936 RepID=A0A0E9WIW4_ANGAN
MFKNSSVINTEKTEKTIQTAVPSYKLCGNLLYPVNSSVVPTEKCSFFFKIFHLVEEHPSASQPNPLLPRSLVLSLQSS